MMTTMQAPPDPVLAAVGGLLGGLLAVVALWRGLWRGLS